MAEDLTLMTERSINMEYREYKYFLPKITTRKIPYGEHARNSFDGRFDEWFKRHYQGTIK